MKKIAAFFYATASGREPVRDFLKDLGKQDSGIIGFDIKTVEIGWPVGMPLCKPLDGGIWEVRSGISGGGALLASCSSSIWRECASCMDLSKKRRKHPRMTWNWQRNVWPKFCEVIYE